MEAALFRGGTDEVRFLFPHKLAVGRVDGEMVIIECCLIKTRIELLLKLETFRRAKRLHTHIELNIARNNKCTITGIMFLARESVTEKRQLALSIVSVVREEKGWI